MKQTTRSILHITLSILFVIYALVYLTSCVSPFVHPRHFWPITFLSLAFPYLFIGMLFWVLVFFFVNKRIVLIIILLTCLGYKNITACFATHIFKKNVLPVTDTASLTLLSWNVSEFINSQKKHDKPNSIRRQIFKFMKEANADVMCLQDFSSCEWKDYLSNFKYIKDTLKYPYFYFAIDDVRMFKQPLEGYGIVIFSRYPIEDTSKVRYDWMPAPESIINAQINFKGKHLRVFTTHLRSMRLKVDNPDIADNPFLTEENGYSTNATIFHKLRIYDVIHAQQSVFVKEQLNARKQPFVFCADLNAVPSSFVYQHIANGLHDCFLENSFGLGRTFDGIAPNIRIDVVLTSPQIKSLSYYSPKLHLSDHYPIVTQLQLP